jgi:branched-chain amino acid transport system permease protein
VLFLVVLAVLYIKHRLIGCRSAAPGKRCAKTRSPAARWAEPRAGQALGVYLGASTAGWPGVLRHLPGLRQPVSFTFFESALILAIVVLGGMGSTMGVVMAAFVLTVAPELLRSFSEYRVLLFGVLMVLMMIWRPRLIRISRTGVTPRKGVAP